MPDSVLLFSTKKVSTIVVPEAMLKDIEEGNLAEDEKQTLTDLGFLVNDADEEKRELFGFIDDLNVINKIFSATIVMNLDCNLACKYCFEGTRKGKYYMTKETADLFVEFIQSIINPAGGRGIEEIKITFYGGEPLLSIDLIAYITERLKYLSEASGITYSAALVTNGTLLTKAVVEKLKPLGLKRASVTLDGPKNIHDKLRPFKSGKGSFDIIVRNLKDACDKIAVQIGGNFTKENYRSFPLLLDLLIENGLTPGMISDVHFDPVTKESKEFAMPDFHFGCETLNEQWLYEADIFLKEEILKRGYKTKKIIPIVCTLEFRNSVIVNYDGSIYKCSGLIGRAEFKVGDIKTGIKDYSESHNLDNWKNEECLNCEYLPLCFGGCRYMKLVRDGNMDGVDCKKSYLDATLETLVRQDIKY